MTNYQDKKMSIDGLPCIQVTIENKDIENLELSGWGFYDHSTDF